MSKLQAPSTAEKAESSEEPRQTSTEAGTASNGPQTPEYPATFSAFIGGLYTGVKSMLPSVTGDHIIATPTESPSPTSAAAASLKRLSSSFSKTDVQVDARVVDAALREEDAVGNSKATDLAEEAKAQTDNAADGENDAAADKGDADDDDDDNNNNDDNDDDDEGSSDLSESEAALAKKPWELIRMKHSSKLLTVDHMRAIAKSLPRALSDKNWILIYSSDKHGLSLNTLHRNFKAYNGPSVAVVRDRKDHIFGGFAMHPWRKTMETRFYGTGEAFLFSLAPETHIYPWTGNNDFLQASEEGKEALAFGGGTTTGHFGLWIDPNLRFGASYPCETFDNPQLSGSPEFECIIVELWGFDALIGPGRLR